MIASEMAEIAALVGDPARANILTSLFDGRALTATELSYAASVSPQTTSGLPPAAVFRKCPRSAS